VGAEAPGLHAHPSGGERREAVKKLTSIIGRGCAGEARARAAAGIARERELRNREQLAANVHEGTIHLSLAVGKHPVTEHPLGQTRGLGFAVAALDADESHQSRPDRADDCAVDGHGCLDHALHQGDHAIVGPAITR